ncbi:hypothetical protein OHA72_04625 [Dactylosporangium sp. NBC_01737]|uniref:hypothetical protein n=1 Tax=Dactylosporangium sp. NBC_01737 TaxID=2975959 RepID=UPI002E0D2829|nr:hypothetical protein OHA72_04625 [Dactylosporangium sp. NBC_01737]
MTGPLHTMLFQWSPSKGAAIVRTSLPEQHQDLWFDRLLPRLSLPPDQHDTGSTCYLQYDDVMALLHRWPAKDGHHRDSTRTRALLGPPDLLTFARAVAVRPGVEPDGDGPFQAMPQGWLDASDDEATFRAAIEACEGELTTFVAGLLSSGAGGRFAVVAPQAHRRALLWGAQRCFGPGECPPWTFSTAEASLADHDLPRIVFVPAAASSRSSWDHNRSWIDVTQPELVEPARRQQAEEFLFDALRSTAGPSRRAAPGRLAPPLPPRSPMQQVSAPVSAPPSHRSALQPVPQPRSQVRARPPAQPERAEYALFVLCLTFSSALFVLLLMWAGSW